MALLNVWPTDAAGGAVTSEARWRKMARLWAPSGIAPDVLGEMAPSVVGTVITVQGGSCWVDGHYCELASTATLSGSANGIAVVRFDPVANTAELLYRDGVTTPTQNPDGVYELLICWINASVLYDLRTFIRAEAGAFCTVGCTADTAVASTTPVIVPFNGSGFRDISGDLIRAPGTDGGVRVVRGGIFLVTCHLNVTVSAGVSFNIGPVLLRGGAQLISYVTNIAPVGTGSIRLHQTPGTIFTCHAGDEIKVVAAKPTGASPPTVHGSPWSRLEVFRIGSQGREPTPSLDPLAS